MGFVNEEVSKADADKYGLDELFIKWCSPDWHYRSPGPYDWTVDKLSETYVIKLKDITETGPSGRAEPNGESLWFVHTPTGEAAVALRYSRESSRSFSASPFNVIWELLAVPWESSVGNRDVLLATLKAGLNTYGYRGIWRQVPNTRVAFDF
jgi:hypothetical protein